MTDTEVQLKKTLKKHNMDLVKTLNDGTYGTIFQAKMISSRSQVAIKLYKEKSHSKKYFDDEVGFAWIRQLFEYIKSSMNKIFDKSRQCVSTDN